MESNILKIILKAIAKMILLLTAFLIFHNVNPGIIKIIFLVILTVISRKLYLIENAPIMQQIISAMFVIVSMYGLIESTQHLNRRLNRRGGPKNYQKYVETISGFFILLLGFGGYKMVQAVFH